MRIAFLVNVFPKLSETFILNQVIGLLERGHEVDIYASRRAPATPMHADVERYHLRERTIHPFQLPTGRPLARCLCQNLRTLGAALNVCRYGKRAASLKLFGDVLPLLGRPAYDIVHCHFEANGLRGLTLRQLGAIRGKLITTAYGSNATDTPHQYRRALYDPLFREGDLFIAISAHIAAKAESLGCPRAKIARLNLGVDPSRFTFQPRTLRPGEPVRILTVARLEEKKGLADSIRAVAKVAETHPRLRYQIVGDGVLRHSLQELITELRAGDKTQLLGWKTQEEIRQLFAAAHLFVLASVTASRGNQEGTPVVIMEALATGLPVLSTRHTGIPELVEDGVSGRLVAEHDVDGLATQLISLIQHPDRWPDLGRAGRAHIEQHYDIHRLNDRLVEIYQELCSRSANISP